MLKPEQKTASLQAQITKLANHHYGLLGQARAARQVIDQLIADSEASLALLGILQIDTRLTRQIQEVKIEEFDFSVRTYNCLKKTQILTLADLMGKTETELMEIRNFGRKNLFEVREKLAQVGLVLGSNILVPEYLSLNRDDG